MNDDALEQLITGYREFHKQYLSDENAEYRAVAKDKQSPRVMVIGCSDSRVNPAILTNAKLGEIFMVHNVANLVPPYKEGKDTHHSTSAAVEFAVRFLKVEHIIILGHRNCGGIRALMEDSVEPEPGEYSFIIPWMSIARNAKKRVLEKYADASIEEQCAKCEEESLLVLKENLMTFPWVKSSVEQDQLKVHACLFDISTGQIYFHDEAEQKFLVLQTEE